MCGDPSVSPAAQTVTCASEQYCLHLPSYFFSVVKYLKLCWRAFLTSQFILWLGRELCRFSLPLALHPGLFFVGLVAAPLHHTALGFSAAKSVLCLNLCLLSLLEKRLCKHCPDFGQVDENEGGKDAGGTLRSAPSAQQE